MPRRAGVVLVLAQVPLSFRLSRRQYRKPLCDLGIPAFGCVLVAQGGAGGGVPSLPMSSANVAPV
jgi:hypothetical protein